MALWDDCAVDPSSTSRISPAEARNLLRPVGYLGHPDKGDILLRYYAGCLLITSLDQCYHVVLRLRSPCFSLHSPALSHCNLGHVDIRLGGLDVSTVPSDFVGTQRISLRVPALPCQPHQFHCQRAASVNLVGIWSRIHHRTLSKDFFLESD